MWSPSVIFSDNLMSSFSSRVPRVLYITHFLNHFWGGGAKGQPARKADNLTSICERIV
jgi:hypothetical protein